eukprot:s704_g19.t1
MARKLPTGTPESSRAIVRLLESIQTSLSAEELKELHVLAQSMVETTTVVMQVMTANGNSLPPEWSPEEESKKLVHHCNHKTFGPVGTACATLLGELLTVVDLDVGNLREIEFAIERIIQNKQLKFQMDAKLAEQQKAEAEEERRQQELRERTLAKLNDLKARREAIEAEENDLAKRCEELSTKLAPDYAEKAGNLITSAAETGDRVPSRRKWSPHIAFRDFVSAHQSAKSRGAANDPFSMEQAERNRKRVQEEMFLQDQQLKYHLETVQILRQQEEATLAAHAVKRQRMLEATIKANKAAAFARKQEILRKNLVAENKALAFARKEERILKTKLELEISLLH